MKKLETVVAIVAFSTAYSVWADSTVETARLLNIPGSSQEMLAANDGGAGPNLSVSEGKSVFSNSLKDEVVGISPQVGMVSYADASGAYRSRAAAGLLADFNATPLIAPEMKDFFLGVTTGGFYSHQGSNASNFFGSVSNDASGGGNLAVLPMDLKVGYHLTDKLRVSVHGGGNLTYRSVAESASFGNNSTGTSSAWSFLPNTGADVEVALTNEISVEARPDVSFAPGGTSLFMGTVGVVAPLSL
jgi:hypothetical protein